MVPVRGCDSAIPSPKGGVDAGDLEEVTVSEGLHVSFGDPQSLVPSGRGWTQRGCGLFFN
jgi:hypothetical protein